MQKASDLVHKAYDYVDKKEGEIWVGLTSPAGTKADELLEGKGANKESKRPTSKLFGPKSIYRQRSDDEKIADNRVQTRTGYTLAGRIVKHPEQRKRAIKFVDELKRIGQEAGRELFAELQRKREL